MINVTASAEDYLSKLIEKKDFDCDVKFLYRILELPELRPVLHFANLKKLNQLMKGCVWKVLHFLLKEKVHLT